MVLLAQSNGDNHGTAATPHGHALPLEEEELIQSQLSKELEEICNAAVQDVSAKVADTSPKQAENIKIELEADVKIEPCEPGEPTPPESAPSAPLGNTALINSAEPPANTDEATQNLINNLSSITSISEINEITELTQSLVESLVQVRNVL